MMPILIILLVILTPSLIVFLLSLLYTSRRDDKVKPIYVKWDDR